MGRERQLMTGADLNMAAYLLLDWEGKVIPRVLDSCYFCHAHSQSNKYLWLVLETLEAVRIWKLIMYYLLIPFVPLCMWLFTFFLSGPGSHLGSQLHRHHCQRFGPLPFVSPLKRSMFPSFSEVPWTLLLNGLLGLQTFSLRQLLLLPLWIITVAPLLGP